MEPQDDIKNTVRKGYATIAKQGNSCCSPARSCCGTDHAAGDSGKNIGKNIGKSISKNIGYTDRDLGSVPEGANLGLGCGNPVALASLREGDTVLDLGSGAGFDCFLAARKVGETGRIIGVDMTPEMIERARENAARGGYGNVEFRTGEIEDLPVSDASVDVIISNCVLNLSPDKNRVFAEAFRVLRPGGRLMISDIVLLKELPDAVRNSVAALVGCLSGAMMRDKYLGTIREAGFRDIMIHGEKPFPLDWMMNDPTAQSVADDLNLPSEMIREMADTVLSITISGVRPHEGR